MSKTKRERSVRTKRSKEKKRKNREVEEEIGQKRSGSCQCFSWNVIHFELSIETLRFDNDQVLLLSLVDFFFCI